MLRRRYIVYGAGAIGCALGGMLQRAGAAVVLIARGEQLRALQARGLRIATPAGEVHLAVQAVGTPADLCFEPGDVVLLCTKSQDTAAALEVLAACAPRDLPIVCAQNGVVNERLAAARFERVYGMLVFAPVTFLEPGLVTIYSAPLLGGLDVGVHPSGTDELVEQIAGDLVRAGYDARAEPRVLRLKYGKLLTNLGNVLQALGGMAALQSPVRKHMQAEAVACLQAAGIDYAPLREVYERHTAVRDLPVGGAERPGGSSWQSLARRTGMETDYLNGEIVALGDRFGVPVAVNRALVELGRRAAAEHWAPGCMPVAEIEAAAPPP
jgi:2-dehydropantoate 2-reductase